MGALKKDIFTSNLFLIDFSFIMWYPSSHVPFWILLSRVLIS